jgi:predicted amidohydrolase YtcJ
MAARLTTYVVVGIVAATLIAGLIVGAQRDDYDGPVDLIVHNGRVFTADGSGTIADAIAVRGNQVLRVGSNRDINRLRRPQTIVIDADGGAVLPGFNDSHLHLLTGGLALDDVDLRDAPDIEEMQRRITEWMEAHPADAWVKGRGWTFASFPDALPTRQLLDAIVEDRPAFLLSADGTAAWVNSRALEMARTTRRGEQPANNASATDARTSESSGLLKGPAVSLVSRLIAEPSREERVAALRAAVAEAHRNGITSVQNADGSDRDFELYHTARKAGDLKIRVVSAIPVSSPLTEDVLDRLEAIRTKYSDDPLFKTGPLKIWLDGTVDSQTAAMLAPYATRSEISAAPTITADDLNRMIRLADAREWQVMTHAAGDRAVRMALDAYQHAARANLTPARGRRHRIEHAENVDPADLRRFGALGVIASAQPVTSLRAGIRSAVLGLERASRASQHRSLAATGARLAFGSDWPAASLNPLLGIQAAVTRTTPERQPESAWTPSERLTLKAALEAYTSAPAWASFDEQRKGTLAPGMLADIVVLNSDIFAAAPTKLASAVVDVTIFDGKIVYRRGAPAPSSTD